MLLTIIKFNDILSVAHEIYNRIGYKMYEKEVIMARKGATTKAITESVSSLKVLNEDGVITHEEEQKTVKYVTTGKEPDFVKLYLDDVLYMSNMPPGLSALMYELLQYVSYADRGAELSLSTGLRKRIAEKLGMTPAVFNNSLSKLTKGKILKLVDRGLYQLNPYFFGRGEWKDISRIRATWDYDAIKGKTFRGVIETANGAEKIGEEEEEGNGEERADSGDVAV